MAEMLVVATSLLEAKEVEKWLEMEKQWENLCWKVQLVEKEMR